MGMGSPQDFIISQGLNWAEKGHRRPTVAGLDQAKGEAASKFSILQYVHCCGDASAGKH